MTYQIHYFITKFFTESQSIETGTVLPENILDVMRKANASELRHLLNNTRRIILGSEATDSRPYMVRNKSLNSFIPLMGKDLPLTLSLFSILHKSRSIFPEVFAVLAVRSSGHFSESTSVPSFPFSLCLK